MMAFYTISTKSNTKNSAGHLLSVD